jgi:hypothetical protein
MAIVVHASRRGTTKEMYDDAMRLLRQRLGGTDHKPEQLIMVAYGDPNDLELLAVWESREAFERFQNEELPVASSAPGIDISNIGIYEVLDIVAEPELVGKRFATH